MINIKGTPFHEVELASMSSHEPEPMNTILSNVIKSLVERDGGGFEHIKENISLEFTPYKQDMSYVDTVFTDVYGVKGHELKKLGIKPKEDIRNEIGQLQGVAGESLGEYLTKAGEQYDGFLVHLYGKSYDQWGGEGYSYWQLHLV